MQGYSQIFAEGSLVVGKLVDQAILGKSVGADELTFNVNREGKDYAVKITLQMEVKEKECE